MKIASTILLGLALYAAHPSYGEDRVASWLSPRMVQGIDAEANQFPYQVTILGDGDFHCGGAILTSNYIVTAAHCTFEEIQTVYQTYKQQREVSSLSVRVGSLHHNEGGEVIGVADYILYPGYDIRDNNNDIALIQLSSPLTLNNVSVAAIPLATSTPPENAEVTIVGWGRSYYEGPASERLEFIKTKVLPEKECNYRNGLSPNHILCVRGNGTNGACNGDSGSAAIYQGTLVGVLSYVFDWCSTQKPTASTSIPPYVGWLKENSDL